MESKEMKYLKQEKRLKEKMSKIKHPLIVMSGKGGVGKTTVAVNLAYALSLSGKSVGILDIDLHGPNIAKMLGIEKQSIFTIESGIEPVEVGKNLKAVSIALLGYNPDQPIIWRGPAKAAVIRQLLSDVNWGDLDYLVIDSPPGTGDEPLSACQLIHSVSGIIIVTTPQDVSILDARKSVLFAKEIKIPVAGIIENMSGFICPHCHAETDIFKKGGGERAADELKVPFLGRVPFQPEFVEFGDKGTPFVSFKEKSKSAEAFMDIVDKVKEFIGDRG
ncbi:MAG: Mrp/NBP35 family ATP-binding protein [Candidatus Omnitrophota bacterium]|nr:Mrp/NBP35 family ATP-binding protein [Candidatus Omnitrophota bacterium]MBU1928793.1 Mrp/NBP35 family ATP-binding protein [Candidatus Omnitrophota bacterium]MBU2034252.1 Mrp/NBP35 family ATP-binding protein [Candidatus Omnitrophota bacterium]MBU2221518.1 Mrp/NBP35 family ATP-binding protein [Candidatus Omnitrophota bacterium]